MNGYEWRRNERICPFIASMFTLGEHGCRGRGGMILMFPDPEWVLWASSTVPFCHSATLAPERQRGTMFHKIIRDTSMPRPTMAQWHNGRREDAHICHSGLEDFHILYFCILNH